MLNLVERRRLRVACEVGASPYSPQGIVILDSCFQGLVLDLYQMQHATGILYTGVSR